MPEPNEEHLKLIQSVITRMASNSFVLKGWAVTLVSGLAALSKADANPDVAWIGCGAAFVFALLDGMYLANERAFRQLYDQTADGNVAVWKLTRPAISFADFLSALTSWSVLPVYLLAGVGSALVATVL